MNVQRAVVRGAGIVGRIGGRDRTVYHATGFLRRYEGAAPDRRFGARGAVLVGRIGGADDRSRAAPRRESAAVPLPVTIYTARAADDALSDCVRVSFAG